MSQLRRIFSGIQPTGCMHLGNYFGAVKNWLKLQQNPDFKDNVIVSIADLHSLTSKQDPKILKASILRMTASLLSCGINPDKFIFFQQSMVPQHTQLCWVLSSLLTLPRLGQLPQYKEKSKDLKEIPLGLFIYPVLQSADILIYKATDVPVGEDQLQHIELARHLAKKLNKNFNLSFPLPRAALSGSVSDRIKSLRNPTKKMSKSDPDPKSRIEILDSPDTILEKCMKCLTDFTSAVTYEPDSRPGVSNLIDIHRLCTGKSVEEICLEVGNKETAQYKVIVAEAVESVVKPIRTKTLDLMKNPDYLVKVLQIGAEKAQVIASETWEEVCYKIGLKNSS